MADNIVDLAAFRKRKRSEQPSPQSPVFAIISDRAHYILHPDGQLQVNVGDRTETRAATHEEMALMRHVQFLEATTANLLEKYAPHLLYDDYITTPFVDWDVLAKMQGGAMAEWNSKIVDHPDILLAREMHITLTQIRLEMQHIAYNNRVGLAMDEEFTGGKLLKASESPILLHIALNEDMEGNLLRASFKAARTVSIPGAITRGAFTFTFASKKARVEFMTRLLSFPTMQQVVDYLNGTLKRLGNGNVDLA